MNFQNNIPILYIDDYIVVVNKPASLPMHANLDPDRENLVSVLQKQLGEPCYLGIHQRLDLDTTGVVLFSRSKLANPGLAKQFESHSVCKSYLALAKGGLLPYQAKNKTWNVNLPLGEPLRKGGPVSVLVNSRAEDKHQDKNREPLKKSLNIWQPVSEKSGRLKKGSASLKQGSFKDATTVFTLLKSSQNTHLLKAVLKTGRKHQIRAHLAAGGVPIIGDALYGGLTNVNSKKVLRPMLHAFTLVIQHPISGQTMEFEAEMPKDFRSIGKLLGLI